MATLEGILEGSLINTRFECKNALTMSSAKFKVTFITTTLEVLTIVFGVGISFSFVKIRVISIYSDAIGAIFDRLGSSTMEETILEASLIFVAFLVCQSAKAIGKAIPVLTFIHHSIGLGSLSSSMIFPIHEVSNVLAAITIGQCTLSVIFAIQK